MTLLLIILVAIVTSILLVLVVLSHRLKRNPKSESLITAIGIVDQPLNPIGSILVHGELWSAQSINSVPVSSGSSVKVLSYQDGRLLVEDPEQSNS